MSKVTKWAKDHKGAIATIAAVAVGVVGIVIWGLTPEKEQPVKAEWIPPVKRNWYMESDD